MGHLDDERIMAVGRPGAPPDARAARHLVRCARCRRRVAAASALRGAAAALDAENAPAAVPSFDALVLPELHRPAADPAPVAAWSASASWRLTAALVWRQARLVPRSLWPLTALGFVLLLAAAWRAEPIAEPLLGPGVTLLLTAGVLAVCEPRRDPRSELLHSLPVPPVAVWLCRLALVVAVDLAAALVLTAAVGRVAEGAADAPQLVASWLGPALLTAALAAFGAVWQSPAAGAVLGGCGWVIGAVVAVGGVLPVPGRFTAVLAAVWTTNAGTLAASLLLIGCAALLTGYPARVLRGGV
ncbi:hypothetical protein LG943_04515 [Streptomonospora sp. S1-112]|uniref:Uncharacterized protein n=1 Tax=Streptomonospora mangrovi TaxID=2883123 RepID=A0A9X3NK78_9ACTN|nr:hypothetical protein [Streptomonospora mangrovi]MDA0563596.1 hypothetical protein [Streptomonospora mangrovi]